MPIGPHNSYKNFKWKSGRLFKCSHSSAIRMIGLTIIDNDPGKVSVDWKNYRGLTIVLAWSGTYFRPWNITSYNIQALESWAKKKVNHFDINPYKPWLDTGLKCWQLIDSDFYNIDDIGSFRSMCQIESFKNTFKWEYGQKNF